MKKEPKTSKWDKFIKDQREIYQQCHKRSWFPANFVPRMQKLIEAAKTLEETGELILKPYTVEWDLFRCYYLEEI